MMSDQLSHLLLEDRGDLLMEDGFGFILLEGETVYVQPPGYGRHYEPFGPTKGWNEPWTW